MVSAKPSVPLKKSVKNLKPDKITKVDKRKEKKSENPPVTITNKLSLKQESPKTDLAKSIKKPKFVMPSQAVTHNIINACLKALLNVVVSRDKQNKDLFDDEKPIFVEIHCMKIPNIKSNIKFNLPHSTIFSTAQVCLVTPDIKKGKKHDHEPTVEHWEELLKNAGVTEVKTILPVRQLKVEYDQFELKRRLLTQHDFIMVDSRVLSHVSHLLGKIFFKKHNMLVPVRIQEKDIKKSIKIGLHTAIMRLGEGETATITVGHTAMSHDKLRSNILAIIKQLQKKYPGGEANVRSITIKLPLSVSLPLYLTLRSGNTVHPPKLTQKRPKHYTVLEDELSTIPGKKVRVAPDGTVKLKSMPKNTENGNDTKHQDEESDEEIEDK